MSFWKIIEGVLRGPIREGKQYNGNTAVRYKDLHKLFVGDEYRPGISSDAPDPQGGVVDCDYDFNPSIEGWNKFSPSIKQALAYAAADKVGGGSPDQYAGKSQGTHMLKKNWGGQVVAAGGKPRSDFERMPSAMDRYDVLMIADISEKQVMNKKTGKLETRKEGSLKKLAYSPSIGSAEERSARLQALMAGEKPAALKQRPQPNVPEPEKQDVKAPAMSPRHPAEPAHDVPRIGGNMGMGHKDYGSAGGKASLDFTKKLAQHNADFKPSPQNPDTRAKARGNAPSDDDDDSDTLFPKKKK